MLAKGITWMHSSIGLGFWGNQGTDIKKNVDFPNATKHPVNKACERT